MIKLWNEDIVWMILFFQISDKPFLGDLVFRQEISNHTPTWFSTSNCQVILREEILDRRIINSCIEYLSKWKSFDHDDQNTASSKYSVLLEKWIIDNKKRSFVFPFSNHSLIKFIIKIYFLYFSFNSISFLYYINPIYFCTFYFISLLLLNILSKKKKEDEYSYFR